MDGFGGEFDPPDPPRNPTDSGPKPPELRNEFDTSDDTVAPPTPVRSQSVETAQNSEQQVPAKKSNSKAKPKSRQSTKAVNSKASSKSKSKTAPDPAPDQLKEVSIFPLPVPVPISKSNKSKSPLNNNDSVNIIAPVRIGDSGGGLTGAKSKSENGSLRPSRIRVDLSKFDNVSLKDLSLDVRPRIKNIIDELYREHDWSWPPAPGKDISRLRFFKRKKNKMFYNQEFLDFCTFLSLIIGPLELFVALGFAIVPKTFILAMRESVEITALVICVFLFQGLFHVYAAILGLALRASRPFEIGYIYPSWALEIALPLLGIFSVFACMYMTQDWMVEREMILHLKGYNFHWYSKSMWDSYQSFMHCCGIKSYKDWMYHGPLMYNEKQGRIFAVPNSCCIKPNCSSAPNLDNVMTTGCMERTMDLCWTIYIFAGICVAISIILLCMGHRSVNEAGNYNGDPIYKLLFDDRYSKKRMYNRSNRREELFGLLNYYCIILGRELGYMEEAKEAQKEEEARAKLDADMDTDKDRYHPPDSYAGNSPPTPSSYDNLRDDLHYVPDPSDPNAPSKPAAPPPHVLGSMFQKSQWEQAADANTKAKAMAIQAMQLQQSQQPQQHITSSIQKQSEPGQETIPASAPVPVPVVPVQSVQWRPLPSANIEELLLRGRAHLDPTIASALTREQVQFQGSGPGTPNAEQLRSEMSVIEVEHGRQFLENILKKTQIYHQGQDLTSVNTDINTITAAPAKLISNPIMQTTDTRDSTVAIQPTYPVSILLQEEATQLSTGTDFATGASTSSKNKFLTDADAFDQVFEVESEDTAATSASHPKQRVPILQPKVHAPAAMSPAELLKTKAKLGHGQLQTDPSENLVEGDSFGMQYQNLPESFKNALAQGGLASFNLFSNFGLPKIPAEYFTAAFFASTNNTNSEDVKPNDGDAVVFNTNVTEVVADEAEAATIIVSEKTGEQKETDINSSIFAQSDTPIIITNLTSSEKPKSKEEEEKMILEALAAASHRTASLTTVVDHSNEPFLDLESKKSHEFDGSTPTSTLREEEKKALRKSGIPMYGQGQGQGQGHEQSSSSPGAAGSVTPGEDTAGSGPGSSSGTSRKPRSIPVFMSKVNFPKRVNEKSNVTRPSVKMDTINEDADLELSETDTTNETGSGSVGGGGRTGSVGPSSRMPTSKIRRTSQSASPRGSGSSNGNKM